MTPDLLRRQLARLGLSDEAPPLDVERWQALLARVRRTYADGDQDRYTLERSLMISSREMRELYEAARVNERRFRRLYESGILGIIVAEPSGAIVEANDTFLNMLGYTRDELLAGSVGWEGITPPEWSRQRADVARELADLGRAGPWEKEYLRKDGTRVPVLVGLATLEGSLNIAVSVDLSDRKQAEADRQRAERARTEVEEQLRQLQKMQAVGNLAGGIAHDFNNILSVILSYGTLLTEDLDPADPRREDLAAIQDAALRATDLIRQLLAFSRRQILQPKPVDLNETVEGMRRMLRRLLPESVQLNMSLVPGLRKVLVDPSQLEQVIMNLAVNARDAMPLGGVLSIETADAHLDETYARAHPGVFAGRYAELRVTDTGTGMDEATRSRVFEPFFTTKDPGKGTGLGLSTVFGIVTQSQGHIVLESELAKGTTFKVYLPRATGSASTSSRPSRRPVHVAKQGSETILLVEDDDQVRAVARGILRRNGYSVLDAVNGGDALLASEQHQGTIDLLLTDVVLPRLNGRQLAERLTATRPGMKVLFMSGYADDTVFRHGVLEPGVAYLQKPITPATLTRKVREVLGE